MSSTPASIAVQLSIPPLPEGWEGTPQDLLSYIQDEATIQASGGTVAGALLGQVGGDKPTTNVGLWIHDSTIDIWKTGSLGGGAYEPLLGIPIGAVLDWPSALQACPENYLFAENQQVLRSEYPLLFAVYGTTYARTTGDDPTKFRLPDFRGRVAVGAADTAGEANPRDSTTHPLTLRAVGTYFGTEWPNYNVITPPNSDAPRYSATLKGVSTTKIGSVKAPFNWTKGTFNGVMQPGIWVRKIIRAK